MLYEDEQERKLKLQILSKLQSLGYNLKHHGTHYLAYTIMEVIKFEDPLDCVLENDIYPIISKHFNKTISNIKSSIHKATEHAYITQKNEIKEFFYFCDNTKPTTKEIIITMINFLSKSNIM